MSKKPVFWTLVNVQKTVEIGNFWAMGSGHFGNKWWNWRHLGINAHVIWLDLEAGWKGDLLGFLPSKFVLDKYSVVCSDFAQKLPDPRRLVLGPYPWPLQPPSLCRLPVMLLWHYHLDVALCEVGLRLLPWRAQGRLCTVAMHSSSHPRNRPRPPRVLWRKHHPWHHQRHRPLISRQRRTNLWQRSRKHWRRSATRRLWPWKPWKPSWKDSWRRKVLAVHLVLPLWSPRKPWKSFLLLPPRRTSTNVGSMSAPRLTWNGTMSRDTTRVSSAHPRALTASFLKESWIMLLSNIYIPFFHQLYPTVDYLGCGDSKVW